MALSNLPDGWKCSTLGGVTLINGRNPEIRDLPDDILVTFLPMAGVEAEQGFIKQPVVRPVKEVRRGFTHFSEGDVLFAKITPSMENGKAAIARNLTNGIGFGSTEFHVLRPLGTVIAEWIFYFIRQEHFRRDAKAHFSGTAGQLRVPAGFLFDYPIPVPPLPEQERIVERIESLFTQLDAGIAGLKRVQAALKRYRASVLKAACEGRLVPQDPNDEPAEEILWRLGKAPLAENHPFIMPDGWCWTKLDDVAVTIGGLTKGRNFSAKSTVLLPYLRVANVQRGRLDLLEMKEIELLTSETEKYLLIDGDIVLTEGGDWDKLGRSAIWRNQIPNCVHQNHIFRARLKTGDILAEWVSLYTNSEFGQNYFKEAAKQTTNLASINLTQLRACLIPLPPSREQNRIITEADRRLSVVAELEQAVSENLKRAARLRQSILKRAFEGKLLI